jgi:hypothetical protein
MPADFIAPPSLREGSTARLLAIRRRMNCHSPVWEGVSAKFLRNSAFCRKMNQKRGKLLF